MSAVIDFANPEFVGDDFIEQAKAAYRVETIKGTAAHFNGATTARAPALDVTVTYLSDNGADADLAIGEIRNRFTDSGAILKLLTGAAVKPEVTYLDIPRQNPVAGALDLAQLSRDSVRGVGKILFVNCAPRLAQTGNHKNNQGEEVYAGVLPNGTIVAGVGTYSFGFFRDLIDAGELELFKVGVQTGGSQFRSRDFFPWFAQVLAFNLQERGAEWAQAISVEERRALLTSCNFIETDRPIAPESVPDLRAAPMAVRIDTHGNIKLNQTINDVPEAIRTEPVWVVLGDRAIKTTIREAMFAVKTGDDAIAPGSTGDWGAVRGDTARFLQIARINGDLAAELDVTHDALKLGLPIHVVPDSLVREARDTLDFGDKNEEQSVVALAKAGLINGFDSSRLRDYVDGASIQPFGAQRLALKPADA